MTEHVRIKVKPGQTLSAPDGRLIHAGEIVEVSGSEAEFFVRMNAAEVVADPPPAAPKKPKSEPKDAA